MKSFIYSITLLLISINPILAQNSTDIQGIIDKSLSTLNNTTIKTNFELSVNEKNKLNSQSNNGVFTMKGQKFFLDMTNTKIWFDGKTQWSYLLQTEEVSITEPTEEELSLINPLAILKRYSAKSKLSFSKNKSNDNYIIDMAPKSEKDDFNKIEVQIDKKNNQLKSIKMIAKNGITTLLNLSNYQKDINVSADYFKFDKTQCKGAYINDLR